MIWAERTERAAEEKLLSFLPAKSEGLSVLLVESAELLPRLRERLPDAKLYAVDWREDMAEFCAPFAAEGTALDYRQEVLPYAPSCFDFIVAPNALEFSPAPQDTAHGFRLFLKDTGALLTTFANVRFLPVLQALEKGEFPLFDRHAFSRIDMERLLSSVFYRDVAAYGIEEELGVAGAARVKATRAAFPEELSVAVWVVKARKFSPQTARLKARFRQEERRELAKLLRRIEYDIDREENLRRLWTFFEETAIDGGYAAEFLLAMSTRRQRLFEAVLRSAEERDERAFSKAFLAAAAAVVSTDEESKASAPFGYMVCDGEVAAFLQETLQRRKEGAGEVF